MTTTKSGTRKSAATNLMQRLGMYKEFIAILAFFFGGALWIYGIFATKQQLEDAKHQLAEFRCLTNTNIAVLRTSMYRDNAKNESISKKVELSKLLENGTHSENANLEISKLKTEIKLLDETLNRTMAAYEKALERQSTNQCNIG